MDHRLRLLFIESVADYGGGSERVSHDLAIQLSRAGHQVFYAVPREGTALPNLRDAGVRCLLADIGPLPVSQPLLSSRRWCAAAQLVLATDADHLFTSVSYLAPLLGSLQAVFGRPASVHLGLAPNQVPAPLRWAMHLGIHGIAPSPWAHDAWLSHGWPGARLACVPNGVDLDRFQPRNDRLALRRSFGWSEQETIITYAGRITPEKGILTLLRAFSTISAKIPRARLALFGGSDRAMQSQLQSIAAETNLSAHTWRWHGPTAHVEQVLAAADIAVVPSEVPETFGLSVVEAMACGCPVAVSNASCLPAVIGSENTDLVFAAGDADALTAILEKLSTESSGLRTQRGQQLRENVAHRFPLAKTVAGYFELFLKRSAPHAPCLL